MTTTFIAVIVVTFQAAPLPSTVTIPGLPDMPACATMLVQQATGFAGLGAKIDALSCTHGEIHPEPPEVQP